VIGVSFTGRSATPAAVGMGLMVMKEDICEDDEDGAAGAAAVLVSSRVDDRLAAI
jgi:hypothetical protein